MPLQAKKLRILCLGDSLTAGLTLGGLGYDNRTYTPYHETMGETMRRAFGELERSGSGGGGGGSGAFATVELDIVEDGVDGSCVASDPYSAVPGFRGRIREQFREGSRPFDWTVVLGGTNDLVMDDAEPIFENLKMIWNIALKKRSRVLALTVPQAGLRGFFGKVDERRDKLNALIKGHKQENFYVFDLYGNMSEKELQESWDDDRVHFTSAGYGLIGRKVGVALAEIITGRAIRLDGEKMVVADEKATPKNVNTGTPSAKRRRVGFRNDGLTFEEEDGDAKLIDQGYVVVRRKDLE